MIHKRPESEVSAGGHGRRKGWLRCLYGGRSGAGCPRCMSRDEHLGTLSGAAPGTRVKVSGHTGGERLASRLAEMGLFKGADLEVLSGGRKGPMIVRSGGSRLALGRGMALKILVNPAEDVFRAAGD